MRGAVVLWGRIELHERGMRAEFVQLVPLALPSSRRSANAVRESAERLEVEAVRPKDLQPAALAHGRPLEPSRLIPTE